MFISLELEEQDFSEITVVMGNAAKLYHVSTEKKPKYILMRNKEKERNTDRFMIRSTEQAKHEHNIALMSIEKE